MSHGGEEGKKDGEGVMRTLIANRTGMAIDSSLVVFGRGRHAPLFAVRCAILTLMVFVIIAYVVSFLVDDRHTQNVMNALW